MTKPGCARFASSQDPPAANGPAKAAPTVDVRTLPQVSGYFSGPRESSSLLRVPHAGHALGRLNGFGVAS
jgi:hypothetical protein